MIPGRTLSVMKRKRKDRMLGLLVISLKSLISLSLLLLIILWNKPASFLFLGKEFFFY
jgi:hypothetical protein